MKKVMAVCVLCSALAACGGEQKGTKQKDVKPAGNDIVARVGETQITKAEFDKRVEKSLSRYRSLGRVNQPAIEARIKQNVLRRMIDNIIFETKAKKMGISISAQDIDVKLDEHKKRFGGEKAFNDYLRRTKNTVDEMKNDIRYSLLREKLVEKIGGAVNVDDDAISDYYVKNKDRYKEPEKVKASHILFKMNKNEFLDRAKLKDMSPEQRRKAEQDALTKAREKAMKKAKPVLAEAKKKGADFAALAKKHSEGPTATKGGDLGFFSEKRMVKPFSEAAFKLKAGEISELVETRFGLHIIKVFEHQEAVQKTFAEVKESIQKSLESRETNQNRRKVLKQLKDEVKVEVLIKFDMPKMPGQRGFPMRPGMQGKPGMPGGMKRPGHMGKPMPRPMPGKPGMVKPVVPGNKPAPKPVTE